MDEPRMRMPVGSELLLPLLFGQSLELSLIDFRPEAAGIMRPEVGFEEFEESGLLLPRLLL